MRRRLRTCSVAWLVCQLMLVTAFLPAECCTSHSHTARSADEECHEPVAPDQACPMHAARGEACPAHADPPAGDRPCQMRGLCDGPAAALASLFFSPAILPGVMALAMETPAAPTRDLTGHLFALHVPPDPPPPRS